MRWKSRLRKLEKAFRGLGFLEDRTRKNHQIDKNYSLFQELIKEKKNFVEIKKLFLFLFIPKIS